MKNWPILLFISKLILPVIFLFVVTPLGILVRLRGDPMARRWKPHWKSYRTASKASSPDRLSVPY